MFGCHTRSPLAPAVLCVFVCARFWGTPILTAFVGLWYLIISGPVQEILIGSIDIPYMKIRTLVEMKILHKNQMQFSPLTVALCLVLLGDNWYLFLYDESYRRLGAQHYHPHPHPHPLRPCVLSKCFDSLIVSRCYLSSVSHRSYSLHDHRCT